MPVTGEGLATSLRSGLDATRAVIEARKRKCAAEVIYLETIDGILGRFREVASFGRCAAEALGR